MTNHFPGHFEKGRWVYDTICKQCGKCCRYAWRNAADGTDDIHVQFYIAKGGVLCNDGILYQPEPCQHLTADNKCAINDTKPEVCRRHGETITMFYPHGCAYREYIVENKIECRTLRAVEGRLLSNDVY